MGASSDTDSSTGSDFRDDARLPGSGNVNARRSLAAQELQALTQLSWPRSLLAVAQTSLALLAGIALGVWAWGTAHAAWAIPLAVVWIAIAQHAWFILNHDAAHYRLLPHRGANDVLGALIGMTGGVSMHTYRVTHRLHHNHLYERQDPDTAIHGGYPRGRAYLWGKLAQDLIGWNAWKTYAYFFGSPAINDETGGRVNPLNDTSPQLRQAARTDRLRVLAFHVLMPVMLLCLGLSADPARGYELFGFQLMPWQALAWYACFWLLPLLTVLQPILRLRAICEHGAVTDLSSPLTAARCNRTWGSAGNWLARMFHHDSVRRAQNRDGWVQAATSRGRVPSGRSSVRPDARVWDATNAESFCGVQMRLEKKLPCAETKGSQNGAHGETSGLGRFLLFPHHVNHHLEHHLYPAVPHYHLRRLHEQLHAKGALEGAQVRDIRDTLALVFAPKTHSTRKFVERGS